MAQRWAPLPEIPPDDHMSQGLLYEYHLKNGTLAKFYDQYPESKPRCTGAAGCPCPGCCKMRGRALERER